MMFRDKMFLLREIDSAEQRLSVIDFGMFYDRREALLWYAGAWNEKTKHW